MRNEAFIWFYNLATWSIVLTPLMRKICHHQIRWAGRICMMENNRLPKSSLRWRAVESWRISGQTSFSLHRCFEIWPEICQYPTWNMDYCCHKPVIAWVKLHSGLTLTPEKHFRLVRLQCQLSHSRDHQKTLSPETEVGQERNIV